MEDKKRKTAIFRRPAVVSTLIFVTLFFVCDFSLSIFFVERSPNRPDRYYHHALKANLSTENRSRWGPWYYIIATNTLGLRDDEPRHVPPVGVRRRILFLGDSFTEGVGVPNDKTFVHIIGDRIRRAGGNIEVMNGGVASHSPRLYLLHLQDLVERKGAKFDEVVVFIDESDIQDELIYQGFHAGRITPSLIIRYVKEYVEQNSLFAYVLFNRLPFLSRFFDLLRFEMRGQSSGQLAHESWDRPNYYKIRDAWVDDDKAFRAWGAYGLKLAHENLSRLAAYAATKGMTISFAVYPWPRHARQIHSRARDVWEKIARKENWTLIDLFPDFAELADPRRLYIRGDVHWNADGHRFVAEHWLAHYCELRHSNWCARLEPPVRSDSARRGQNENSINDVIQ